MAEADRDGRAARIVGDLMAVTVTAFNEGVRETLPPPQHFPACNARCVGDAHFLGDEDGES